MTLATCERLLAHYEVLGNKEAAREMKARVELKRRLAGAKPQNSKSK